VAEETGEETGEAREAAMGAERVGGAVAVMVAGTVAVAMGRLLPET
jgi:hypothetical protein